MGNKKYLIVLIALLVSLSALGPAPTKLEALTAEEAELQLSTLSAQLESLQSQLNSQSGASDGLVLGATTVDCAFTHNLYLGVSGTDVKCLQQFLNSSGFVLAGSGPGSAGSETTYFGPLTRGAVSRWQGANGISPTAGYFGPISRTNYNQLIVVLVRATPTQTAPAQTTTQTTAATPATTPTTQTTTTVSPTPSPTTAAPTSQTTTQTTAPTTQTTVTTQTTQPTTQTTATTQTTTQTTQPTGPSCGNGTCESGETTSSCAVDCPTIVGEPTATVNPTTVEADTSFYTCPALPATFNNFVGATLAGAVRDIEGGKVLFFNSGRLRILNMKTGTLSDVTTPSSLTFSTLKVDLPTNRAVGINLEATTTLKIWLFNPINGNVLRTQNHELDSNDGTSFSFGIGDFDGNKLVLSTLGQKLVNNKTYNTLRVWRYDINTGEKTQLKQLTGYLDDANGLTGVYGIMGALRTPSIGNLVGNLTAFSTTDGWVSGSTVGARKQDIWVEKGDGSATRVPFTIDTSLVAPYFVADGRFVAVADQVYDTQSGTLRAIPGMRNPNGRAHHLLLPADLVIEYQGDGFSYTTNRVGGSFQHWSTNISGGKYYLTLDPYPSDASEGWHYDKTPENPYKFKTYDLASGNLSDWNPVPFGALRFDPAEGGTTIPVWRYDSDKNTWIKENQTAATWHEVHFFDGGMAIVNRLFVDQFTSSLYYTEALVHFPSTGQTFRIGTNNQQVGIGRCNSAQFCETINAMVDLIEANRGGQVNKCI